MLTNNLLVLKKTIFSLALCWTVLIAVLCLVKFGKLPTFHVSGADKYVHFTFHFVFTLLWGYYVWIKKNKAELKSIVKVFIVSLLYGILIEFLQETLTTTRHADIYDVMANATGATTALGLFLLLKKLKMHQQ
jgi:VanZ family protein